MMLSASLERSVPTGPILNAIMATMFSPALARVTQRIAERQFGFEDMSSSGQLSVLDESDLQITLNGERSSSTRDLPEELSVSQRTVVNKLH
ncbi:hypothetical protein KIN20_036891 [Parelaphostrongylus tenuis]|uniref:Uncharacterized protein n=1 Tax=Parelaphostrongylus tenuis TaxID=148309 RepID=A0AAD5RDG4_PARTN|nr:hypothetical protein KIN20_036891 [Parelaphostrongylus tenuis]